MRYFKHHDVEIGGVRFEVHPGASFSSAPIVYRRDDLRKPLRRVRDLATVKRVLKEWESRRETFKAMELKAKAMAEAQREDVRRASMRWRTRKMAGRVFGKVASVFRRGDR